MRGVDFNAAALSARLLAIVLFAEAFSWAQTTHLSHQGSFHEFPTGLVGSEARESVFVERANVLCWKRYGGSNGETTILLRHELPFARKVALAHLGNTTFLAAGFTEPEGMAVVVVRLPLDRLGRSALVTDETRLTGRIRDAIWSASERRLYFLALDPPAVHYVEVVETPSDVEIGPSKRAFGPELAPELVERSAYRLKLWLRTDPDLGLGLAPVSSSSVAGPMWLYRERAPGEWERGVWPSEPSEPESPAWLLGGRDEPLSTETVAVRGPAGAFEIVREDSGSVLAQGTSDGSSWTRVALPPDLPVGLKCFVRDARDDRSLERALPLRAGRAWAATGFHSGPLSIFLLPGRTGRRVLAMAPLGATAIVSSGGSPAQALLMVAVRREGEPLPMTHAPSGSLQLVPDMVISSQSMPFSSSRSATTRPFSFVLPSELTGSLAFFQMVLLSGEPNTLAAWTDVVGWKLPE